MTPQLLNETSIPPADHGLDVRLYLRVRDLEAALEAAKASPLGRAVIHGARVVARSWQDPEGHRYDTFHLAGQPPTPEQIGEGPRGASAGLGGLIVPRSR